ncbi:hypothetical protein I7I53_06766 [Histoplasma capsulatum var. duboisii H88]|uniref:Uncharacterized protein n=1 Tax=Ajellomyces capsulatus (strain H88) TaxID=544711 RepID=A0A8A1LHI4_AJEC8|nr:hypothetical protein I7I53_06766 [Histoplasma capsulatum var. duboisii H88]
MGSKDKHASTCSMYSTFEVHVRPNRIFNRQRADDTFCDRPHWLKNIKFLPIRRWYKMKGEQISRAVADGENGYKLQLQ